MIRSLELKIPPPVVAALIALGMWAIAPAAVGSDPQSPVRLPVVAVLVAVGAAFDLSALLAFRRAKTTVNPMKPARTSSVVQSGVYSVTRNPMYIGLFFFLCAWAAYLWSFWPLIGPIAFVGYINRLQIEPEERMLTELFGAEYLAYQRRVRRWL